MSGNSPPCSTVTVSTSPIRKLNAPDTNTLSPISNTTCAAAIPTNGVPRKSISTGLSGSPVSTS